jgi:hypothetical protein
MSEVIKSESGNLVSLLHGKVGYVPKADNIIFSRLMDAGKLLFGRIVEKEVQGNWLKIDIKVFLHE